MPRVKLSQPRAATPKAAAPRPPPAPMRMQDRPGRWKLIWRRQRQILRPALAGSVLVGGLLMVGTVLHAIGQGASFRERMGDATARLGLRVQDVVINGQQKTPDTLLRAAIGLHKGDSILAFSPARPACASRRSTGCSRPSSNASCPGRSWSN